MASREVDLARFAANNITPHVLRHSFASLAADMGYSEPTIAALIGHKNHSITSRYLHSADAVLLAAADAIAAESHQTKRNHGCGLWDGIACIKGFSSHTDQACSSASPVSPDIRLISDTSQPTSSAAVSSL